MKKIVLLVIAVSLISALFLSCKKQSDEKKNEAGSEDVASEKAGGQDEEACKDARKENTRAAWERYLREFPSGKCAEEGKSVRNKFKKIGGVEWSDLSEKKVFHVDAEAACYKLEEDGHKDWRLPTIDELRSLVQNHPGTVSGGKCRVLNDSLLNGQCSENNYEINIAKHFDDNCKGIEGADFSKLGDTDALWSGTAVCNPFRAKVCGLDFSNGGISVYIGHKNEGTEASLKFRCVRRDVNEKEHKNL